MNPEQAIENLSKYVERSLLNLREELEDLVDAMETGDRVGAQHIGRRLAYISDVSSLAKKIAFNYYQKGEECDDISRIIGITIDDAAPLHVHSYNRRLEDIMKGI